MHTDSASLLIALRKAHAEIKEFRAELALAPANELPDDWDAVVTQEWLAGMASDIACDSACLLAHGGKSYAKLGIDSTAGFIASFWETHHLLFYTLKDYPKAVGIFFEHAEEILANAIDDNTPSA
jgi:hypothetical protein